MNTNLEGRHFQHIKYQYVEAHDIHELELTGSNRETSDEFFIILSEIFTQYIDQPQLRIILIRRGNHVPIGYFFTSAQQFLKKHAERPITRTVVLHEKGKLMNALSMFVRLLRMPDKVRYMEISKRDEAIEWLTISD